MTRPPFPEVVDSTFMASLRSCGRKTELESILHYKPRNQSVHLHAGAAYAHALETARTSFFLDRAAPADAEAEGLRALISAYGDFECPPDSAKSLERMCGALEYYFEQYPMENDSAIPITLPGGRKGIEFSFAEPLPIDHPETGNPLLYCGRMDMVVEFSGSVFGLDDKTTSSLGPSWARQWDLRSQFTGYTWGARQTGIKLDGFLVRGVSILKTKYETQQAITYRPQWQIDRWYEQTCKDLLGAIQQWEQGEWNYNLDHACTEYGGCVFRQVCLAPDPEPWLHSGFERRRWDPVTRTETLILEKV